MNQRVEIVKGTTKSFDVLITNPSGVPIELASGEQVVFGIKKNENDDDPIFVKTVNSGTNGVFTITIVPPDTENLEPGQYYYDVSLASGNNFYNAIPINPFVIIPNVTKRGL